MGKIAGDDVLAAEGVPVGVPVGVPAAEEVGVPASESDVGVSGKQRKAWEGGQHRTNTSIYARVVR